MFLRNVGCLSTEYMVLNPKRQVSSLKQVGVMWSFVTVIGILHHDTTDLVGAYHYFRGIYCSIFRIICFSKMLVTTNQISGAITQKTTVWIIAIKKTSNLKYIIDFKMSLKIQCGLWNNEYCLNFCSKESVLNVPWYYILKSCFSGNTNHQISLQFIWNPRKIRIKLGSRTKCCGVSPIQRCHNSILSVSCT